MLEIRTSGSMRGDPSCSASRAAPLYSLAEIEVRAIDLDPTLFADWDPDEDEEAA